ncbi:MULTISPECIES: hypothetical protein [Brevundimonas]|uniref:Uncharacterized protein n=1 Tax=Brevundimonas abyssalis TAR-001 TaxID=1391729 RepID=A0A8E0TSH7_9CAUL|nr:MULTISPECIES: hypothetical protein [Brevundimonas]GAD60502.1 hypothetical protein MBEBAB_2752 [Brevundimonas abyssalis TAR-001]
MSPRNRADDRREHARLLAAKARLAADVAALEAEFRAAKTPRERHSINEDLYLCMLFDVLFDWQIEALAKRLEGPDP